MLAQALGGFGVQNGVLAGERIARPHHERTSNVTNTKEFEMNRSRNTIVRNLRHNRNANRALANALASATSFEALESRQHCTASTLAIDVQQTNLGPTLIVNGTNKSDRITVSQNSRGFVVTDSTGSTTIRRQISVININTGRGSDRVTISSSVKCGTIIDAGAENDVIRGGSGRDTIVAGAGSDRIYGNAGNDVLLGNDGGDSIYGGAGKDQLIGGAGDDTLVAVGGGSNDSLSGDGGFDSYWMDDSLYEQVMDIVSSDESYNMAVHRVGEFMDFVTTNGQHRTTPRDLSGQRLADPEFAWDDSGYYTAEKYENFYGMPLFATDGPTMDDINQGAVRSCYFLSTIAAVAKDNPDWIKQSVVDFGDGTFGVRFIGDNFQEQFVRVDGDLPVNTTNSGGSALAYASFGRAGSLWGSIMEKAWTYFRKSSDRTDGIMATSYQAIGGGWLDEAFNAMGASNVFKNDPNENPFMNGDELLTWIDDQLTMGNTLTYATTRSPTSSSGLVKSHAYTVLEVLYADNGQAYLKLRNPWGTDGDVTLDGVDDGIVYVAASDAFDSFMQVGVATL